MGEFFKPWRRKIGVVTLGLSIALAATDYFDPTRRDKPPFSVETHNYEIPKPNDAAFQVFAISDTTVTVPGWIFVIPLTLLSVWLLLSKPQPTKTQNQPDNI